MKNSVTVLSFLFIFMVTAFVNYAYANSEFSLSNKDTNTNTSVSPQSGSPLVGTVVETMDGGGYTYILLQTKTKQIWVAVGKMKVNVGQNIALMPGIEMTEFRSKSINRTFDSIIFSDGPITQQEADQSQGSLHGNHQKSTAGSKGAKPPASENIKVDKATGEKTYTVAELFEKRSELNKKEIILSGKVVKVSPQIMRKNWLHIQDGTGAPQNGTNDIVVTTQDLPSVGDIVTIKGILYSDKDFGSGYMYNAIIEEAQIIK